MTLYLWSFLIASWPYGPKVTNNREHREYREYREYRVYREYPGIQGIQGIHGNTVIIRPVGPLACIIR